MVRRKKRAATQVVTPSWRALPAETSRWQKIAAHISHGALYLIVILVALLGWAHSGARTPDYSDFFGLFHVPQFTSPDREAAGAVADAQQRLHQQLLACASAIVGRARIELLAEPDEVFEIGHDFSVRAPSRSPSTNSGSRRSRANFWTDGTHSLRCGLQI